MNLVENLRSHLLIPTPPAPSYHFDFEIAFVVDYDFNHHFLLHLLLLLSHFLLPFHGGVA